MTTGHVTPHTEAVTTATKTEYPPGLYWHVHHRPLAETLAEYCWSYEERCKAIRSKPLHEQATRLKLLRPVRGPLPPDWDKAHADLAKANADWDKAHANLAKVYANWNKVAADWNKAIFDLDKATADKNKATADLDKTNADLSKAYADLDKAIADWDKAYANKNKARAKLIPALLALHKTECGCDWTPKRGISFTQEEVKP